MRRSRQPRKLPSRLLAGSGKTMIERVTAEKRPLREERTSAAIQGSAGSASAAGLVYLVMRVWPQHNAPAFASVVVYGVSMVGAFLASALYHGVQDERIKPILQEIDHCTIFLFIAGTYTPVAMLPQRQHRDRRIGAGDEEEDGAVVDFLQNRLDALVLHAVIEGGGEKGADHRHAVDDDGSERRRVMLRPDPHDEVDEARGAGRSGAALDGGARPFFPERAFFCGHAL